MWCCRNNFVYNTKPNLNISLFVCLSAGDLQRKSNKAGSYQEPMGGGGMDRTLEWWVRFSPIVWCFGNLQPKMSVTIVFLLWLTDFKGIFQTCFLIGVCSHYYLKSMLYLDKEGISLLLGVYFSIQKKKKIIFIFPCEPLSSREWDSVDSSVRSRLQNRSEDGEFWWVSFKLKYCNISCPLYSMLVKYFIFICVYLECQHQF